MPPPVSTTWSRLPAQLATIASLRVGDKVSISASGGLQVDSPCLTRPVARFLRGASRLHSMVWIEHVIRRALEAIRARHGLDPRGSRSLTCQLFGVHCGLRRLGRTYEGDVAVRHKIASMQELLMACVEEGIHHRCRRRRTTPVWSASPLESHAPRQLARSNSQNDAQRAFNGDESGHHQTGGRCDFIRGRALEAILD